MVKESVRHGGEMWTAEHEICLCRNGQKAKDFLEYGHEADPFFAVYLRRGHRVHWYAGGIPTWGGLILGLAAFFTAWALLQYEKEE